MVRGIAAVAAILLTGPGLVPGNGGAAFARVQDEAATARAAAEAIDSSSKPAEAEAAWRKVITIEQAAAKPDLARIALATNRIGDTLYYRGRPDLAQKELEGARDMLEAAGLGDSDAMSETLANLGTMHTAQGRPEQDIELQKRGLAIRLKLYAPDDNRLALNYFNMGYALYEAGYPGAAADNLVRGVTMRLATMKPENPDLFLTLASAAGMVESAGRANTAIEFSQKAVELVTRYHPGHPYAGFVRGTLGKALLAAGRASESVTVTRQALDELVAAMGEENPLTQAALANLAVATARLGRFDEAMELTLRSIPKDRGGPPTDIVRALISASNYAAENADDDRALALALDGQSFAAAKLAEGHQLRAQMDYTLAMHLERRGETARALELMRGADAIYQQREDAGSGRRLASQIYLGGLEIDGGAREAGYARVTAAAEKMVPDMYAVAEDPELGDSNNSYYESFARAAEAAVQVDRPADAFRYYQLATYNANARASAEVSLRAAAGRNPTAAAKVRELQDASRELRALNVQKAALLTTGKIEHLDQVNAALAAGAARLDALRRELRQAVPGFDRLSRPEIEPLEAVQARLAPGEALFVAMPSRSRTTLMLIQRDTVRAVISPLPRAAMRKRVAMLRGSVDAALASGMEELPAFDLAASHGLYRALFPGALVEAVAQVKMLHVAASDALAAVPFALLVARAPSTGKDALRSAHWLIRDTAIDVPVTMAAVGRRPRRDEAASFAGIGAPALSGARGAKVELAGLYRGGVADVRALRSLPALPHASNELAQMRGAFGDRDALLLTGAAATEAAVRRADLSRYSVVAFATHGLIADQIDGLDEPALVLTPPDTPTPEDDGVLAASEIAGMRLSADWVILSACNTAAGATQIAPSYTGLAHAFLYAGADSLLLSHWQVRDDVAARLSVAAVRGSAAGMDRAEALRQAMLALIGDRKVTGGSHPAVWAPFILVGQ